VRPTTVEQATEVLLEWQQRDGGVPTIPASAETIESEAGWAFFNANRYLGTVTFDGEVVLERSGVRRDERQAEGVPERPSRNREDRRRPRRRPRLARLPPVARASFLIVAARLDEAAVTAVMGHSSIETTRRIYAGDWREAEERNEVVLRQLADAGIGQ
jgi:integrase